MKMETSAESFSLLQLIANDAYKVLVVYFKFFCLDKKSGTTLVNVRTEAQCNKTFFFKALKRKFNSENSALRESAK